MTKNFFNELSSLLHKRYKEVSYTLLGVGLCIFALNISAMLSVLPMMYDELAFNVSVFGSILMVVYIVYSLHEKK